MKKNVAFKHISKYFPLYLLAVILTFFSEYIISLVAIFIGEILAIFNGESNVLPSFFASLVNRESKYSAISSLCLIFIVTTLIGIVIRLVRSLIKAYATNKMMGSVTTAFFAHVIDLPKSYLTSHSTGDIIQRNLQDTKKYIKFYGDGLWHLLTVIFSVITVLMQLWRLNTISFICALIVIALVVGMGAFFCLFYIKKKEEISSKLSSQLDSRTQQTFTNISMVKSFANEKVEKEKFNDIVNQKEIASYKVSRDYSRYWFAMDGLSSLYGLVAMIIIGYLFVNGNMGLGVATSLILLSSEVVFLSSDIVSNINSMIKTSVAKKRLNEYFNVEKDFAIDGSEMPTITGDIEFKNVSMAYGDDLGTDILKDVSFKINKGDIVGIVGKSGSGKSSIINVLTKVDDYQKGSITLDGVELKDINKKYLRDNIAIVNQESFVFAKTIKENLTILNKKEVDLDTYVDRVCLREDIAKMNDGYETIVGEKGITLSGGQRQRIAIARSLIKESNILILDDSLSALDNNVSKKIKEELLKSGVTTIIISHNLMNIMDADLILVLDDGKIVDRGKHSELIKREGIYKKVWSLQQSVKGGEDNE